MGVCKGQTSGEKNTMWKIMEMKKENLMSFNGKQEKYPKLSQKSKTQKRGKNEEVRC